VDIRLINHIFIDFNLDLIIKILNKFTIAHAIENLGTSVPIAFHAKNMKPTINANDYAIDSSPFETGSHYPRGACPITSFTFRFFNEVGKANRALWNLLPL